MDKLLEMPNWEEKFNKLQARCAELEALVKFYEEQIRLAKQKRFGASRENYDGYEQCSLFNEAEAIANPNLPEPTLEEISYKRKKRSGKRAEDLSGLPVETIVYTLSESERICADCGNQMHQMSVEIRRELTIIPAQAKVTEHVQHIFACRDCEKNSDHTPIVKAKAPEPVIQGSLASPSAVAHIMVEKYVKAVPLYRQEQGFARDGVALSRQTMANWLIKCSETWLFALYLMMKSILLQEPVLHADETVVQVLHEKGKTAQSKSYEWVYRTSGCAKHPIVLYEYQPSRSAVHPKAFFAGFTGFIHTDGYEAYHNLLGITVAGCWAHVRRKFDEALKAIPADKRKGSAAEMGIQYCQRLFMLEREFASLSFEERHQKRLEHSKPVSDAFFAWAKSANVLPASTIGKAVKYAINQQKYLENVFLDGRLEICNNRAERSVKPFVIGRKNWLFSNTPAGAEASSVIYSIIETAKENNLKPFEYIKYLLESLPNTTTASLEDYLPWSEKLPDYCRCPQKAKEAPSHAHEKH